MEMPNGFKSPAARNCGKDLVVNCQDDSTRTAAHILSHILPILIICDVRQEHIRKRLFIFLNRRAGTVLMSLHGFTSLLMSSLFAPQR